MAGTRSGGQLGMASEALMVRSLGRDFRGCLPQESSSSLFSSPSPSP
eukprot:CAMPEP_0201274444 /NCGR_PEP_ID=MMETSP0853-20130426/48969_1 /ASSEMBLY_ACC=CAM_ASM_000640 /TAXON_ID=183588 /ORGANISM="Pseudo-nitzschia fraudulenta, Strain WWA7" /LENGTH=46 /DNA_ID= /DNA_START= /DNA_END= /DNA_ORIENTATION=